MSTPIHWHEGLFLRPQHLQAFQRTLFHHVWSGPALHSPFAYGVVEARYVPDELARGTMRFDRLHVVLPGGTVFRFPEDADLPSLNVGNLLRASPEGITIGLAVPLWQAERANTNPYRAERNPGTRFQVHEEAVADENDGSRKRAQPVQFLRLNGRLEVDGGGVNRPADCEFMPLIRVSPADVHGAARSAPSRFVPATLLLAGSPVLFELVRGLAATVGAVRDEFGEQLALGRVDLRSLQGAQFAQISRLRCLSRGAALLGSLVDDGAGRRGCAGRVPTFDAYLALQDLLAELSALYPVKRVFSWLPYDHDDPYPAFADLEEKIRALVQPAGANFREFAFRLQRDHFFGEVPRGFFQGVLRLYLSIETDQDGGTLARLVEDRDRFKLLPASFVEELAARGLVLRDVRGTPDGLPLRAGRSYYEVDLAASSPSVRERFQTEPRAAVHFQAPDLTRYQLALYATLPATPDDAPPSP